MIFVTPDTIRSIFLGSLHLNADQHVAAEIAAATGNPWCVERQTRLANLSKNMMK